MYYYLFGAHFMLVVAWVVFFLLLIVAIEHNLKEKKLFAVLSLVFMLAVLGVGTKMMLLNPAVTKSGMWLHIKLSFDILVMLENIYFAYVAFRDKQLNKKFLKIVFWINFLIFMIMICLTIFKPI